MEASRTHSRMSNTRVVRSLKMEDHLDVHLPPHNQASSSSRIVLYRARHGTCFQRGDCGAKTRGAAVPQYVECTSFNYIQISSGQAPAGGGHLYVYLYRVVDSHDSSVCGYSATASESNGPSGTLTAKVLGFSCGLTVKSNSTSSTGTASVSSGIGPGDHPNFKGEATIGSIKADTGCVSG